AYLPPASARTLTAACAGRCRSRPIGGSDRPLRLAARLSVPVEAPLCQIEGARVLQQEHRGGARSIVRVQDERGGEDALPLPGQAGLGQLLILLHEGAVFE